MCLRCTTIYQLKLSSILPWLRPGSRLCCLLNTDRDCKEYVASSIKAVLVRYGRVLGTDLLEGLPHTTSNHIFNKELMDYTTGIKWTQIMEKKVQYAVDNACVLHDCHK